MSLAAADPSSTRIGWIGTGVMGHAMCGHLLAAGYPVTLTTRTRERAAACCVSRSAALMTASWFSTRLTARSTDDVMLAEILRIRLMMTPCEMESAGKA